MRTESCFRGSESLKGLACVSCSITSILYGWGQGFQIYAVRMTQWVLSERRLKAWIRPRRAQVISSWNWATTRRGSLTEKCHSNRLIIQIARFRVKWDALRVTENWCCQTQSRWFKLAVGLFIAALRLCEAALADEHSLCRAVCDTVPRCSKWQFREKLETIFESARDSMTDSLTHLDCSLLKRCLSTGQIRSKLVEP